MNIRCKNPDEIVLTSFDYTLDASEVEGVTVQSVTVTVTLVTGVDPAPGNLLWGAPVITSPHVMQQIQGGLDGCRYRVRCLARLSDGRQIARTQYFDVANP